MTTTPTYQRPVRVALLAALGLAACRVFAAVPTVDETKTSPGETVTMDKLQVNGVPIEQQILPTSRPFNSVFGTEMSILDTPRNVTIISREQMNVIGIQETRDFSKLTASSYTQTNFGLPSNPSIRGQTADVLVNGMRRGLTVNGNGMPVNFNAVESVNIVKGTASVIYGATSYTGGYADFITKKPFFDKFRGSAAGTVGMYEQYRWTLDFGGPISPTFAYRLSYSGEDSGSYYYGGKKNTQAIYGAIEWHPNPNYSLEMNSEFYVADFTENWGINRVTQQLIDTGLYIPDAQSNTQYAAFAQTVGGFGNPVQAYGTPVKLDRRTRLLSPGDDSYGINITAQAIQTLKLGPGEGKLVNNTFFNYINRDTFSSYYYASVHKDNYGLENRLQYTNKMNLGEIASSFAAGFSARYQSVWAADDFFHEPINSWDLTRDGNLNRVPAASFGGFNASVLVPGFGPRGALPGVYVTPGASYPVVFPGGVFTQYNGGGSSNDSDLLQFGPFYQHNFVFTKNFSVLAGIREDFLKVKNTDPVPPPGFTAVSDSISVTMPSYNASAIYKINDQLSAYYTYSFATSAEPGLGGGYAFLDTSYGGDARHFYKFQFDKKNTLQEVGFKSSLVDGKLFIGAALYDQQQKWDTMDGLHRYTKARGFEIEANLQPNKQLFATVSYSYFDSKQRYAGFLADSMTYDKRIGSAVPATPDFPSISQEFQQPGMPKHLVNVLLNYKFTPAFSASLGMVMTGEIITSQVGQGVSGFGVPVVLSANKIHKQQTFDATLNYNFSRWNARLALMNVTNEKNWSAPNPGYGDGAISAELPFHAELTMGLKF
jgi:hypothetical protein